MNLQIHRASTVLLMAGLSAFTAATTSTAADIEETRSTFAEWARIQTLVSRERTDWKREKETLKDTLETARLEAEILDERIEALNASSTEADRKRGELTVRIEEVKGSIRALAEKATAGEAAVRTVLPLLPDSLRSELQPLLNRLPADSGTTKLPVSQRMQTLAGILAQVEKFQSGISLISEIKKLDDGTASEVKTLYFGLAAAFFSDASGTTAGYGAPLEDGWKWTSVEGDAATRIASAIAIHENTAEPAFIVLPVEIH